MFTLDVVEFDDGVPDRGRRGGVGREKGPLHPRHCKQVPLGAPLHNHIYRKGKCVTKVSIALTLGEGNQQHTFETSADESGREVIVVVHEADVSRGEPHRQQGFLSVH